MRNLFNRKTYRSLPILATIAYQFFYVRSNFAYKEQRVCNLRGPDLIGEHRGKADTFPKLSFYLTTIYPRLSFFHKICQTYGDDDDKK